MNQDLSAFGLHKNKLILIPDHSLISPYFIPFFFLAFFPPLFK